MKNLDQPSKAVSEIAKAKSPIQILPYSLIVGQEKLKLALELAYIADRMGGVLLSGQRGTGKSTAVRAFAIMIWDCLPVTLPINATEDRVVGGWEINQLMQGKPQWQDGLIKEANKNKLLYIDEVNLLDDHIVNIILDVTSTGVLVIQRDGQRKEEKVSFTLVGTMNPEEGGLRPQLLDRFGLMVNVKAETHRENRIKILETVMAWDKALFDLARNDASDYLDEARAKDEEYKSQLEAAKEKFLTVEIPRNAVEWCVQLTEEFKAEGNRGDYTMALASRAYAALNNAPQVSQKHIAAVAELVLQHRRPEFLQNYQLSWEEEDEERVKNILQLD